MLVLSNTMVKSVDLRTPELKVKDLKAQVYDLMVMRDQVNQRLQNLNQLILQETQPEPKEKPKTKESKSK